MRADADPQAATTAGAAVADAVVRLLRRLAVAPARVAAYESLPTEPPTGPLIASLVGLGHSVIVPVTLDDFSLEWRYAAVGAVADVRTIARRSADDLETMRAASGLLGPKALSGCDLVVVPALSVDRHGTRLGQGGGSYDRALLDVTPGTTVVALLHDGEESAEDLPRETHDRPVDGYVTTSGRIVLLTR